MDKIVDIIIIGAGPAGSTLARLAAEHKDVVLLDKESDEKCCGGLLAPAAQKQLATLGVDIPKYCIESPQLFSVHSYDIISNKSRYYQRFYINIKRKELDKYLLGLSVDAGVRYKCAKYISHVDNGDYVSVEYIENGIKKKMNTRILIGADGAVSRVRKNIGKRKEKWKEYICIQEEYEWTGKFPYYGAYFDKRLTDYYGWFIPKGNKCLLGAAFYGSDVLSRFDKFKKGVIEKINLPIGKAYKCSGAFLLRPRDVFCGKDRVLLIGEAGGFVSPSSGEGISYAFRSAKACNDALNKLDKKAVKRYKRNSLKIRFNIFLKNIKKIPMYNYFLRNFIFSTGINSLTVYKNKLTEK